MGNIINFKENNDLIKQNKKLLDEIESLKNIINTKNEKNKEDELKLFYKNLEISIDKYVTEMLKDEEINSIIPDNIEKKLYKNIFTIFIKLFKNITDSTKINFLDQELTLNIKSKTF